MSYRPNPNLARENAAAIRRAMDEQIVEGLQLEDADDALDALYERFGRMRMMAAFVYERRILDEQALREEWQT